MNGPGITNEGRHSQSVLFRMNHQCSSVSMFSRWPVSLFFEGNESSHSFSVFRSESTKYVRPPRYRRRCTCVTNRPGAGITRHCSLIWLDFHSQAVFVISRIQILTELLAVLVFLRETNQSCTFSLYLNNPSSLRTRTKTDARYCSKRHDQKISKEHTYSVGVAQVKRCKNRIKSNIAKQCQCSAWSLL